MSNSQKPQVIDNSETKNQDVDKYMSGHESALMHMIDAFIMFQMESEKFNPAEKIDHLMGFRKYMVDVFDANHGKRNAVYLNKIKTKKCGPWAENYFDIMKGSSF